MKTSRRNFLKTAAIGGAALVIGFDGRRLFGAETAIAKFQPNGWIRIDAEGSVTLTLGKSEMGQGVRTALPMILADELGADWSRVKVVQAMPGPDFKRLGTGGSGSVQGSWKPLREAAAAAREMLTQAAAKEWQVEAAICSTEAGAVRHPESGRSLAFGRLVEAAAKLPVPQTPQLKKADDFRIIGQRTSRIDAARDRDRRDQIRHRHPCPGNALRFARAPAIVRRKSAEVERKGRPRCSRGERRRGGNERGCGCGRLDLVGPERTRRPRHQLG